MTMEAESNHIYQGLTDQSPWVPKDYGSRGQVHDTRGTVPFEGAKGSGTFAPEKLDYSP